MTKFKIVLLISNVVKNLEVSSCTLEAVVQYLIFKGKIDRKTCRNGFLCIEEIKISKVCIKKMIDTRLLCWLNERKGTDK